MEEINNLGFVSEYVERIIMDNMGKNMSMQEMAKQITQVVSHNYSKWNWTVLCGDKYEVSTEGRKNRDVMYHRKLHDNLKVLILRGSPLDKYTGGPAILSIVRNKLQSPQNDSDHIRMCIEHACGDSGRMVEHIRKYLKDQYPRENWIVIAGDDFALSQDYEQMPSLAFCATVGHISVIVVKAQAINM